MSHEGNRIDVNEIIISLVQEHKFLYDRESYSFKNKNKKVWFGMKSINKLKFLVEYI